MTRMVRLVGAGLVVASALGLSACYTPPPGTSGDAVDAAYGIPPNTMPKEDMRNDGTMINGLLPLPPNSGS